MFNSIMRKYISFYLFICSKLAGLITLIFVDIPFKLVLCVLYVLCMAVMAVLKPFCKRRFKIPGWMGKLYTYTFKSRWIARTVEHWWI